LVLSQLQSVDIFHFFVPKDLLLDYCSDLWPTKPKHKLC